MDIKISVNNTQVPVYRSYPQHGKHPAVIIIHEIWGLNDNIRDIASRVSNEGYYALAPDLFADTPLANTVSPEIMMEIRNPATKDEAQKKMRAALAPMQSPEFAKDMITKLQACYEYVSEQKEVNGDIAVMGFCFGGTYSFALAVEQPGVKAAVSFYGHGPEPIDKVAKITCPVLAFYGEEDVNLIKQLPELEQAMQKYHKNFEYMVYKNAGHAFFNDQNQQMYRPEAAKDSWAKTLSFFSTHLTRES